MNNADMPAMPIPGMDMQSRGLSKREYIAAMAIQGILSQQPPMDVEHDQMGSFMSIASEYAAIAADALLAELERTGGES